jgi:hypothetical protein
MAKFLDSLNAVADVLLKVSYKFIEVNYMA